MAALKAEGTAPARQDLLALAIEAQTQSMVVENRGLGMVFTILLLLTIRTL